MEKADATRTRDEMKYERKREIVDAVQYDGGEESIRAIKALVEKRPGTRHRNYVKREGHDLMVSVIQLFTGDWYCESPHVGYGIQFKKSPDDFAREFELVPDVDHGKISEALGSEHETPAESTAREMGEELGLSKEGDA